MTKTFTTLLGSAALLAAAPAMAGDQYGSGKTMTSDSYMQGVDHTPAAHSMQDFAKLDRNSDGRLSFAEYYKHAQKKSMTSTQAAQLFVKMTGGGNMLDQGRFETAMAMGEDYYLSQMTSVPNTAVLSSGVNPYAGADPISPLSDMPSEPLTNSKANYDKFDRTGEYSQPMGAKTMNGMTVNPNAGINATSPMADKPSEQILDSGSTYEQFETTGEYSD